MLHLPTLKCVFQLEENVSRAVGQNSSAPCNSLGKQLEFLTRTWSGRAPKLEIQCSQHFKLCLVFNFVLICCSYSSMFLMLVYLRKYRYPFFSSNVQIGELFFKWPTSSNQTAKRLFTRYQIIFIEFQVRDQVTSADNFMLYWVT